MPCLLQNEQLQKDWYISTLFEGRSFVVNYVDDSNISSKNWSMFWTWLIGRNGYH